MPQGALVTAQGHSRCLPTDGNGQFASLSTTGLSTGRDGAMPLWHIASMWE